MLKRKWYSNSKMWCYFSGETIKNSPLDMFRKNEKPCAWKYGVDVWLFHSLVSSSWLNHHSVNQNWRKYCSFLMDWIPRMVGIQEKGEYYIPLVISLGWGLEGSEQVQNWNSETIKIPFSKSPLTSGLGKMMSDLEGYNFSYRFWILSDTITCIEMIVPWDSYSTFAAFQKFLGLSVVHVCR